MVDFLKISTRSTKRGVIEVYPKFIVGKSSDLMIRGGDFYAIWLDDIGLWSTDEQDVIKLIDRELDNFVKENKSRFDETMLVRYMWDSESGVIDSWHKYVTKQMRDNYHTLNENLVFSNQECSKELYASKRLPYPLVDGECPAWNELISSLYAPEERHKIEWAIGSIVNGASKTLEKFCVLYGAPGTGKGTILKIIEKLFPGYYTVFDAKSLASSSDSFALEPFKNNPLVGIQHDGDLSKIEDNTRINSLTSHETMNVNEKHKNLYSMKFISFLFMGTNRPVKITDAKSGIIRRLIDVRPLGEKIPVPLYNKLNAEVKHELGAIAYHCKQVFEADPLYYDDYKPTLMMGESNDFYNFVLNSYMIFSREDGTTLKAAWEMYKQYCEEAKVPYPFPMRVFKSELMNYFKHYEERVRINEDWVRSYYSGFKKSIFKKENIEDFKDKIVMYTEVNNKSADDTSKSWIDFQVQPSNLDKMCSQCPAQYGNADELPKKKWDDVNTVLEDITTSRLHYVKLNDINHIVIDFDLKGPDGIKSFERNLEEASKWPKTYAELSKSGKGIHLHYIYDGDAESLNRLYADDIEVKVFTGNSALRRKLTKCNAETINHLPEDYLPKRKERPVINFESLQNEKALRTFIRKNLNKEYHPNTKPSIDFIYKGLEDAYNLGMKYDVRDMYNKILCFAASSTNNADYCVRMVEKMHFNSDEQSDAVVDDKKKIVFYDVETFPNLFLVNWKYEGKHNRVNRLFNPTPKDIAKLINNNLIGFNCRRYDNHMIYAALLGYTNEELFNLSQKIIVSKSKMNDGCFQEAYNISYTDIYDYAQKKQSLKKWEIELGIHHKELGLPWDKPVPENLWQTVGEYCDNDVIATEATWNATQEDFKARVVLTKIASVLCTCDRSTVNDTTNILTRRIVFRNDKKPQSQFLYTDLATGERSDGYKDPCHFPGYVFSNGKSMYLDEEVGEGGYVWAKPGMYKNVKTLDVASMHPHSIIALNLFGDTYTEYFKELVDLRVDIKHQDWESAKKRFGGILSDLIDELLASGESDIAGALKIAINSVYGQTAAHFENAFRDPRNIDNIVAKRGALFMCMLKHEVQEMGAEVVHIKTDSIKISNLTPEVEEYIIKRGKEFGYDFEVESIYEKFCLVNDAVYIAKKDHEDPEYKKELGQWLQNKNAEYDKPPTQWTATGTQFQIPYVFKKCFSHEPIEFSDLCETKEVKSVMHLDLNENLDDGEQVIYEKLKSVRAKALAGDKLTGPESKLLNDEAYAEMSDDKLNAKLASYHQYQFIGRVSLFTPIKPGCGGGELVRENLKRDGSIGFDSVVGTKGYRWLESEEVIKNHKENDVDLSYYDNLVNDAIDTISTYGDYEWFVSED